MTVRSAPGRNGFELPGSGASWTSESASIGRAAASYTFQLMYRACGYWPSIRMRVPGSAAYVPPQ